MRTNYTFTVITACYNVENWLDEAVQSLLAQDIGFEEHIQLVLVDDGSTDNTGAICDKYALQYPDNIEVIHQSNAGVSTARNAGMRFMRGKYVNFLDSDDKLSHDVCRVVYDFFEKNTDEADMVAIPMFFFDAAKGRHPLNYKFKNGSRIINLDEEPACIQLSLSSAFVKAEVLRSHFFDVRLSYTEDAKVAHYILSRKRKLGVIDSIRYMYRRRSTGSSAIQRSRHSYGWYLPWNKYYLNETIEAFKDGTGRLPGFVQYALMYDLQWRFTVNKRIICKILTEEEFYEWRNMLFSVLKILDDTYILRQKYISCYMKAYLLCKKYGSRIHYGKVKGELSVFVEDCAVYTLKNTPIYLHFLRVNDNSVVLEGEVRWYCGEELQPPNVILAIGNEEIECKMSTDWASLETCFDEPVMKKYLFFGEIRNMKSRPDFTVELKVRFGEYLMSISNIITCRYFPVSLITPHTYCSVNTHLASINPRGLRFSPYSRTRHLFHELRYLGSLAADKPKGAVNALRTRLCYWLTKPFVAKDIWLVSDRINKADDNGEAFYNYINQNKLHPHNYFVVLKKSGDLSRLKKRGKVIGHLSLKHQVLQLHAQCIISSQADEHVILYAKPHRASFFMDLLQNQKHIFLQHGVIMNDLSGWLNRWKMNLSLFLTSAKGEYESIARNPKYGFDDGVVRLLGMPRFDRRVDEKEKLITIAPTWRKQLCTMGRYFKSGARKYDETSFARSSYYRFYQSILTDRRLLECAERTGYRIQVMLHPNAQVVSHLFRPDPRITMLDLGTSYQEIYRRSALMLTDYSSCVFDFAYLRKPVLYCQFDQEAFFSSQWEHGYFSYERNGFGEVETTLEGTVNRLVEYMENGCKLKPEYRKRIDSFFAFNDRNNCKRVYEAMLDLL